jgi:hypothetical protein
MEKMKCTDKGSSMQTYLAIPKGLVVGVVARGSARFDSLISLTSSLLSVGKIRLCNMDYVIALLLTHNMARAQNVT